MDRERERVRAMTDDLSGWRRWGPYVADRAWGTVREDHSPDLTYDKARAKEYRWGEDGIAGICDRYQLLCFAPAFWNERDLATGGARCSAVGPWRHRRRPRREPPDRLDRGRGEPDRRMDLASRDRRYHARR